MQSSNECTNNIIDKIPGLLRRENTALPEMQFTLMEKTHTVYPHDQIYGDYCPIQIYIDVPPEKLFDYMNSTKSLEEWSYSIRDIEASEIDGVDVGYDRIGDNTKIYCKVVSNREALTIDYHCAWDQGEDLWMIYLNRIVPAELVLGKSGSVIFWQNCKHPNYDKNPYPETAPKGRPWVGEFWDLFYAGHTVEIENLKKIAEYRFQNDLPMVPFGEEK